jgi:hypothetical protein
MRSVAFSDPSQGKNSFRLESIRVTTDAWLFWRYVTTVLISA